MAAAGMADGEYDLGGQAVAVADGVARLARNGSIAGSTLTMDAALRRAVGAGHPAGGRVPRWRPPRRPGCWGWPDQLGALAPGLRADLVVLDGDLRVQRVMRAGVWV